MTKLLKQLVHLALIGLGFGSFFYLTTKLFLDNPTSISRYEVSHYLIMSIFISWYTLLFNNNKLSYYSIFPIHFTLTFITVILTNYLTLPIYTLTDIVQTFIIFLLIYIIVNVGIFLKNKQSIDHINHIITNKRDN